MNSPQEDRVGINTLHNQLRLILTGGLKIFPTTLAIVLFFAIAVVVALALVFKNFPLIALILIVLVVYKAFGFAISIKDGLFNLAKKRGTQALFFGGGEWRWDHRFDNVYKDDRKLRPSQSKLIATRPVFPSDRNSELVLETGKELKE